MRRQWMEGGGKRVVGWVQALPGACAELSSEEKMGLGGLWLECGANGRERAGIRWVAGGLRSDLVGVTSVCGYRGGVSELVG